MEPVSKRGFKILRSSRKVNKRNPFEHPEVYGLIESANWLDYPLLKQNEEYMQ